MDVWGLTQQELYNTVLHSVCLEDGPSFGLHKEAKISRSYVVPGSMLVTTSEARQCRQEIQWWAAFPPPFPHSVGGIEADHEAKLTLLHMRLCRLVFCMGQPTGVRGLTRTHTRGCLGVFHCGCHQRVGG
ncbi:hypothetical protein SCLCIDRAFT_550225 [Scleroderma citrinum Foug A]|uniref:Uncharacterized protein n=1 Tax=Scleroderma citrinum Foug A TaxID=1036808 RepID=A0A0C3CVD0_9AGAM|nr:hypothetical protein SCLCIDRAFT_550225 [Scleroderma citrinum Foug A]